MDQLAERLLPIPKVQGSNPVIGDIGKKTKRTRKEAGNGKLLKIIRSDGHGQMLYKKFFAETVWPIVSLKPQ